MGRQGCKHLAAKPNVLPIMTAEGGHTEGRDRATGDGVFAVHVLYDINVTLVYA